MQAPVKYSDILDTEVLPDNRGFTPFLLRTKWPSLPTSDLFHELSKSITGALSVKIGRVYISFWRKESAIYAFLNKTERWFMNMRFTFPRCKKD